MNDSRLSGIHRKRIAERVATLVERGFLSEADARMLAQPNGCLSMSVADKMVENVVSVFGMPFAVAPNFLINGKDCIAPMVVEEPSVVAGVSSAARLMRSAGGFDARSTEPILIGQIQLIDLDNPLQAVEALERAADDLLAIANTMLARLVQRGGGARSIEFFSHVLPGGQVSVVAHIAVDTRDAMGANLVNSLCEGLAPKLEEISGGRSCLRILSNLADQSLVTASVIVELAALHISGFGAENVRDGIVIANDLARVDRYRATTHNKGIMNGVDAVAIATGNDWRSIEASVHSYACRDGQYRSLTTWSVTADGDLRGELTLPLKVGIVGGSLQANPAAAIGLRIAAVDSATELAELMCCVGLAQNFAALRALVTSGIQKGHMSLHARSVATVAGAPAELFEEVVKRLVESGEIRDWKAAEIIDDLRLSSTANKAGDSRELATGTACGKVILLGEHAAVYGRHVLALPLIDALTAKCRASVSGMSLSVPAWNFSEAWNAGSKPSWATRLLDVILGRLGLGGIDVDIEVETRLPMGMGLGSSAALAVALVRAISAHHSRKLDDDEVNSIAFECEKLSHGNPSGIDNTLAVFGSPVLFSSARAPAMQALELDRSPPIVVAFGSSPGLTAEQVAGVRARRDENTAYYDAIFDQIDAMSRAGAEALVNGEYQRLGAMMNICHGLLNAIGVSTAELECMVSVARQAGAIGAKLTGAGGGGSIVALCPDTCADVELALREAGYETLTLNAQH